MAHLKQVKYSANEVITVSRSYVWTNGTKVYVNGIWSDKHADLVDYIVTEAPNEPELIGRRGDTPPNSFYWQTDWPASNI